MNKDDQLRVVEAFIRIIEDGKMNAWGDFEAVYTLRRELKEAGATTDCKCRYCQEAKTK